MKCNVLLLYVKCDKIPNIKVCFVMHVLSERIHYIYKMGGVIGAFVHDICNTYVTHTMNT